MTISIVDPAGATSIFTALLILALLLSVRRRTNRELFPLSVTQELKGLSVLAIVFAHVGYGLVEGNQFLFPLSIFAGAGVDLFLFLSGYGLVLSVSRKGQGVGEFYRVRLPKLYAPFWISLTAFFALDYLLLDKAYAWSYVASSYAGLFTSAVMFRDLNSPLWYFSFIILIYLLFPLVFNKRRVWLSALAIYAACHTLVRLNPEVIQPVIYFYSLHDLAFPLGMVLGGLLAAPEKFFALGALRRAAARLRRRPRLGKVLRALAMLGLVYAIAYTGTHAGLDQSVLVRQLISLSTMAAFLLLFLLKPTENILLHWFGLYSYEIYLLHWPLLSRYDVLFRTLPAWLALALYLPLLLGLGMLLRQMVGALSKDELLSPLERVLRLQKSGR